MGIHSSYLHGIFNQTLFRDNVKKTIKFLRKREKEFDAIAFRGNSGAIMAGIVALALNKKLIMVRKDEESTHWSSSEGADCDRYLILDDLISSGNTVRMIVAGIQKAGIKGKPVGIYCWGTTPSKENQDGIPIWK